MKHATTSRMPSPITGTPMDGLFPEEGRSRRANALSWLVHGLAVLLLWWAPSLPGAPELPPEIRLPGLVFLVEPGPGGGGGGGGNLSPEPPSELKIEGEDQATVAVDVKEEDKLVFEEEVKEVEEDPLEEELEEEEREIEAPVVAQAPDDVDAEGQLEALEQLTASAGPRSGNGMGEGEGPGLGEGHGGGFGGGAYRLGTGIVPPALLRQVRPSYTDEALARKIQGTVVLEVVILKTGEVGPVRILRSLDRGLDMKAIEAVRQWQFKPGMFRSQAVDVIAEITVDFALL
ncbi:MAG: energy transducer TonB [Vicinamibacteria bacterium]